MTWFFQSKTKFVPKLILKWIKKAQQNLGLNFLPTALLFRVY